MEMEPEVKEYNGAQLFEGADPPFSEPTLEKGPTLKKLMGLYTEKSLPQSGREGGEVEGFQSTLLPFSSASEP